MGAKIPVPHAWRGITRPRILLVEDNVADQRLAVKGLQEAGLPGQVDTVQDGEQAVAFLSQEGPYADRLRPHLIILDLNLPKKDGREVLAQIKGNRDLKRIPVVVLTTSDSVDDVEASYQLGANCFLTKQPDLEKYFALMKMIAEFWFRWVQLPTQAQRPIRN